MNITFFYRFIWFDDRIIDDTVDRKEDISLYSYLSGNIDLFVGGVAEKRYDEALVGPTFSCIMGEQFRRIRDGDRFWFVRIFKYTLILAIRFRFYHPVHYRKKIKYNFWVREKGRIQWSSKRRNKKDIISSDYLWQCW